VTAQVMMTLRALATGRLLAFFRAAKRSCIERGA
jgi:hypothetical protein